MRTCSTLILRHSNSLHACAHVSTLEQLNVLSECSQHNAHVTHHVTTSHQHNAVFPDHISSLIMINWQPIIVLIVHLLVVASELVVIRDKAGRECLTATFEATYHIVYKTYCELSRMS